MAPPYSQDSERKKLGQLYTQGANPASMANRMRNVAGMKTPAGYHHGSSPESAAINRASTPAVMNLMQLLSGSGSLPSLGGMGSAIPSLSDLTGSVGMARKLAGPARTPYGLMGGGLPSQSAVDQESVVQPPPGYVAPSDAWDAVPFELGGGAGTDAMIKRMQEMTGQTSEAGANAGQGTGEEMSEQTRQGMEMANRLIDRLISSADRADNAYTNTVNIQGPPEPTGGYQQVQRGQDVHGNPIYHTVPVGEWGPGKMLTDYKPPVDRSKEAASLALGRALGGAEGMMSAGADRERTSMLRGKNELEALLDQQDRDLITKEKITSMVGPAFTAFETDKNVGGLISAMQTAEMSGADKTLLQSMVNKHSEGIIEELAKEKKNSDAIRAIGEYLSPEQKDRLERKRTRRSPWMRRGPAGTPFDMISPFKGRFEDREE